MIAYPRAVRDGWLPYEEVHGSKHTVTGTVMVWPKLRSKELGRTTEVLVYLPPSLGLDGPGWSDGRRYPTIYFHDGQNVFDERTSYAGEWRADETAREAGQAGLRGHRCGYPQRAATDGRVQPVARPRHHQARLVSAVADEATFTCRGSSAL